MNEEIVATAMVIVMKIINVKLNRGEKKTIKIKIFSFWNFSQPNKIYKQQQRYYNDYWNINTLIGFVKKHFTLIYTIWTRECKMRSLSKNTYVYIIILIFLCYITYIHIFRVFFSDITWMLLLGERKALECVVDLCLLHRIT